jgi:hypothetical protein
MESSSTPTNYKQVTVDVPEERVAEFHAFFARFLAGGPGSGRGRRGRHGRPHHHGRHGHGGGCAERRGTPEQGAEPAERPAGTTEL